MSIGRFAIAGVIALGAVAASPARADNCSILQGHYQQFEKDRAIAIQENKRANAAHPSDGHFHRDQAYCMALRQTMDDTLLLLIVDDDCFKTQQGAADFKAAIEKIGRAAASETGFFCSPADLKAPLRPHF